MKHTGPLIVADISGYTKFLTATELEHADGILRQIFETLLPKFSLPLRVSNLQGDAIFAYATDTDLASGQYLLDFTERIYCLFSRTRDRIKINSDCPCKACAGVADLDLKFVIHFGEYTSQRIGDRLELAGPNVVTTFRLLKNTTSKQQGIDAYALMTESALHGLDLGKYFTSSPRHQETYDHLGEVRFVLHDLAGIWEQERERQAIRVSTEERLLADDPNCIVPISPEATFVLVTRPEVRARILDVKSLEKVDDSNPRFEKGTTYRCHHGRQITHYEIIDWQPGEYVTSRLTLPFGLYTHETLFLTPEGDNTKLKIRYSKAKGGNLFGKLIKRPLNSFFARKLPKPIGEQLNRLVTIAEETAAKQSNH